MDFWEKPDAKKQTGVAMAPGPVKQEISMYNILGEDDYAKAFSMLVRENRAVRTQTSN